MKRRLEKAEETKKDALECHSSGTTIEYVSPNNSEDENGIFLKI